MLKAKIEERARKVYDLILNYQHEQKMTSTPPTRQVQIKSYIHCFSNELNFLNSLNEDMSELESDNSSQSDTDFDNDEF